MGKAKIDKRAFFNQLEYIPHEGQEQLHAAMAIDGIDFVLGMCGTRFGKTWAAAHEMVYQAMLPREDFMGWCVGPSIKVSDAIFDMVTQLIQKIHGKNFRCDRNDGVLEFANFGGGRSRIMKRTTQGAKGKARLAAYAVDFMVIDEATDPEIHDSVWESQLRTRLVDRHGKLLAISTPRGQRGWFVAMHRKARNTARVLAFNFPSWLNTVRFPGGFKDPAIQREYATMDLRDFLQEYGAQPLSAEGCIFEPETVDQCCVLSEWEEPIAAGEYAAGFDIGLKRDSSVLTIVRAPLPFDNAQQTAKVVFVRRMHKMPVEQQLALVKADQDHYGVQTVYVDGTGMGEPVIQQARNLDIYARSVVFSKKTKMPLIINLKVLLERQAIRLPTPLLCPTLRDQLLTYEWDKNGQSANAPSGFHDDFVCSLALACKFFPAAGTSGGGQAFHVNKPPEGVARSVTRRVNAAAEQVKVTRIRVGENVETPNVFTSRRTTGGGLFGGNSVVD